MNPTSHRQYHRCLVATPAKNSHGLRSRARNREKYPRTICQAQDVEVKTEYYNRIMMEKMNWSNPYEYHFDRCLYYHEVDRNLLCGGQPRHEDDIRLLLEEERVTAIVNLQQDKDMAYWGVDFNDVQAAAAQRGVAIHRRPARDFDPESLRKMLPAAVKCVDDCLQRGERVYVHCTAGLGRAPAVCIAYMYWFGAYQLDEAYKRLTDIRPCGPKRDAIRGATYDLLDHRPFHEFAHLPSRAWAFLNHHDKENLQKKVRLLKE